VGATPSPRKNRAPFGLPEKLATRRRYHLFATRASQLRRPRLCCSTAWFRFNKSGQAHVRAWQFDAAGVSAVTTAWVLTEVADAFAAPGNRDLFHNY
jgi:hypothetical protein